MVNKKKADKGIVVSDPRQDIDNVLRYRGKWEGNIWFKFPRLTKVSLILFFLIFSLMIAPSVLEKTNYSSSTFTYFSYRLAVILFVVLVVIGFYVLYIAFFGNRSFDESKLRGKEKKAIEKVDKMIEERNKS